MDRIAGSTLVAAGGMDVLFGARAGAAMSGLAPRGLACVGGGGTPWAAVLLVGAVSMVLAATGTFERLLSFAILLVLLIDGSMVVLFRLRRRRPQAPFLAPLFPGCPLPSWACTRCCSRPVCARSRTWPPWPWPRWA